MFTDRRDAGRRLARRLSHLKERRPVVLGLPRGGVVVAAEIAASLDAPLDVLVVRKIPAPHQPELALGAVTDGADPHVVLNDDIVSALGVSRAYLTRARDRELAEVERRQTLYRGGRAAEPIAGRTVIAVDDGVATGATVHAGLDAIRAREPAHLVLAVPVAAPDAIDQLEPLVDELVCLSTPDGFMAVGAFYLDFEQTTDGEVVKALGLRP